MARPVMSLVAERHLTDLLKPPSGSRVLEASGVIAKDGAYFVVFDNIRRLARVDPGFEPGSKLHSWLGPTRPGDGYEDIAFSPHTRRFYLLVEAEKHPDGTYKGLIDECSEDGRPTKRRWIEYAFAKRNTGFEGLVAVRRNDRNYLLALCEGNGGNAGRKGRTPGNGRIQVLQQVGEVWKVVATIALPPSVKFEDYASMSLRHSRLAVISQKTSRLWIGTLRFRDWSITGSGRIYDFPRNKEHKPKYCTLEGVCWLSPRTFVTVSDLSKGDYAKRCRKRDQSIQVFRMPAAARRK